MHKSKVLRSSVLFPIVSTVYYRVSQLDELPRPRVTRQHSQQPRINLRRLMSTIVDRTANLQSCILYIYSTNIGTEYFKHAVYSPFFPLQNSICFNSNVFGSCIIHILYTGCAKIKKKIIVAPKG